MVSGAPGGTRTPGLPVRSLPRLRGHRALLGVTGPNGGPLPRAALSAVAPVSLHNVLSGDHKRGRNRPRVGDRVGAPPGQEGASMHVSDLPTTQPNRL
jgi:hypothetical protein